MSENKVEKPVKINLETFDEETLQDTYHLIRHINHYVGSARLSLLHLEHFSKKWKSAKFFYMNTYKISYNASQNTTYKNKGY